MRLRHSKLTRDQTNRLIERFVAGTPARMAASLIGVNKDTAATFYHRLRVVIAENLAAEAGELAGEVEVDESHFGGARKGKRGRGAAGKVPAFGLSKRGGRVFVVPVKDTRSDTPIPVIARRVQPDGVVHADSFRAYGQLDVTDFRHSRIDRTKLFAGRENHINGIENFTEPGKTTPAPLQRHPPAALPAVHQGMRTAVQSRTARPTLEDPPRMAQTLLKKLNIWDSPFFS